MVLLSGLESLPSDRIKCNFTAGKNEERNVKAFTAGEMPALIALLENGEAEERIVEK